MKPRITVITIGVDDLERSVRFYRDGLGLPTDGIVGILFAGTVCAGTLPGCGTWHGPPPIPSVDEEGGDAGEDDDDRLCV